MLMHDFAKEFANYYNEVNAERIEAERNDPHKRVRMTPMTLERSTDIIIDFMNFLVNKINTEDRIYLSGLGVFKHVKRAGRYVLHPVTKERTYIPEQDTIVFKMTKNLKEE